MLIILAGMLTVAGCGDVADYAPEHANKTEAETREASVAPPASRTRTEAVREARPSDAQANACLVQDDKPIPANALHAIGTEPFWAADVEGRCVTYSTPEDQKGTRIWTRFEGTLRAGAWTGALDGKPFVMATKAKEGCSDGMSDKSYPIAVTLTVEGEQRTGCAEPR